MVFELAPKKAILFDTGISYVYLRNRRKH